MAIRLGSWGLPEFGITEKIQSIVAPKKPLSSGGGSNLFSSQKASTGQVQGVNMTAQNMTPKPPVNQSVAPAAPRPIVSGGGGGQIAQAAPQQQAPQQSFEEQYFESQPAQPTVDFDSLIAPALQAYQEAEGAQQGQYDASVKDIETGAQNQKTGAESARKGSEQQFAQRAERTTSAAESAINESRRAASELQQGLASRYGSSISTGLGAQSILGAQSVRNIGTVRTQLASALNEIETARTGVQETYNNALKEIDLQTETTKQQARATLQQNLATIGQGKAELQSRKAELAYQAMEQYRQEVNAVNQRNTAFKQQLEVQRQGAEQKLQQIQSTAQNRYQSLSPYQFKTDSLGQSFIFNPNTGTTQAASPTGVTSGTFEKDQESPDYTPTPQGISTLSQEENDLLGSY